MIVIVDDTFIDRHKFHDVSFLEKGIYKEICSVFPKIKTTDLPSLTDKLADCKLFCYHKTLQLYSEEGNPLGNDDNIAHRERLINKALNLKIRKIEFSRGLETNFLVKQIDKDLFYSNLKSFLDYFIQYEKVEERILFYGPDFEEQEKLSIIQNMMMRIRSMDIDAFENDEIIEKGISLLYPYEPHNIVLERWIKSHLSKNDIIKEINNQID